MYRIVNCLALLAFTIGVAANVQAAPMVMEFSFPGGFPVSLNSAANIPSGPLTFTLRTDNTTPDLDAAAGRGRFALTSIELTAPGLGFAAEPVVSPTLFVDTFADGMTIIGVGFDPDIGWNGGPAPSTFMGNINDLSTLPLPTFVAMTSSTFFIDTITLASGDTLGATVNSGGPDGTFSAFAVPEPSTFALAALGLLGVGWIRRKRDFRWNPGTSNRSIGEESRLGRAKRVRSRHLGFRGACFEDVCPRVPRFNCKSTVGESSP